MSSHRLLGAAIGLLFAANLAMLGMLPAAATSPLDYEGVCTSPQGEPAPYECSCELTLNYECNDEEDCVAKYPHLCEDIVTD